MVDSFMFIFVILIFAINDGFKEIRIRRIEEVLTVLIEKQEKEQEKKD